MRHAVLLDQREHILGLGAGAQDDLAAFEEKALNTGTGQR